MEKNVHGKPRILLFGAMVSLFWMSLYTYQPILTVHSYSLGASTVLVGSILSAYGFTQMFFRVPIGLISDRLAKRKLFVTIGCLVSALSALGLAFAQSPIAFMIFRGATGVAASFWVSFTVLFSDYFDPSDAPAAMARVMLFNQFGRMLSMLVGGQAAERFGDIAAFLIAGGVGCLAMIASFFITEVTPVKKEQKLTEQLGVGLDKTLLIVSTLALLYQIIQFGATVGFTSQYAASIGFSSSQLGILAGLAELGMITACLLNTRFLLKRIGPRLCILIGVAINAIATILISFIATSIPTLMALQFFVGLGNGLGFPLLMGLSIQNISGEKRGVAMGFYQSIYALGMFIGPLFTGFLVESLSLRQSFSIVGSTGIVTFVFAFIALARSAKTPKSQ